MNETQIRELLETAGQDIAAEPIDADSLLAASRRSARTRRLVQVLSVSTAVAVIVALGIALIPRGGDPQKPSTEPATEERLAPPGMRLVGMNGVAVAVPEDWGTNQTRCDVAVKDTVVFDKGTYRSCPISPPPDSSSVHLARASSLPGEYWKAQVDHFKEVDGMRVGVAPVRPVSCSAEIKLACAGGPAGAVVVAGKDVAIWAQSRDESLVRDLLASVQLIPDGYTAVPDVAGRPEGKARETLEQAGLRAPDEVVCRQSDGGPWVEMCSDVTGSDVPQGSVVPGGSEVELLSSPSQFSPSARLLSERRLEISVYGSSSCPDRPDSIDSAGNNQVTVHLSQQGGRICTADLGPNRSIVTLPADIDTGQPISLTLVLAYAASHPYSAVLKPPAPVTPPSPGATRRLPCTRDDLAVILGQSGPAPGTSLRTAARSWVDSRDGQRYVLTDKTANEAYALILESDGTPSVIFTLNRWPNGGWAVDAFGECRR